MEAGVTTWLSVRPGWGVRFNERGDLPKVYAPGRSGTIPRALNQQLAMFTHPGKETLNILKRIVEMG